MANRSVDQSAKNAATIEDQVHFMDEAVEAIRDALLAEGLGEEHQCVRDSGWVTFRVRSEKDLQHAQWLLRLSYFRYALKTAADPRKLLSQASEELQLTVRFKTLLEAFIPSTKNQDLVQPFTA